MLRFRSFLLAVAVASVSLSTAYSVEPDTTNWPRFRGPLGTGVTNRVAPTKWSQADVAWDAKLPVDGHSSPILWGEHVYLTGTTTKSGSVQRHVICLNRDGGKVVWNQVAATGSGESVHKMNGWATPSCATDGDVVVAFFGKGGLHAFDAKSGKPRWSRQLGDFPGSWGVGASPILLGDRVIQNCDAQGASFLLAADKQTGKDVWKQPRSEKPRGGWSTPMLIEANDRKELVLNGEFGVQSYNVETGEPFWFAKSTNGRGTPSPVYGSGKVYVVCGKSGDTYAVKPGGQGDVTSSHIVWRAPRKGGRDLPSPVFANDSLVVISMKGIASSYDADSGKLLWRERLGGNFSSSPIAVNGLVYASAENGEVAVFRAGKEFELIARNQVDAADDEIFRSSLAVSDGQIFLRSNKRIYCIGERAKR